MKNARFNTAQYLDLGVVKDRSGSETTAIAITALNLKITAKDKTNGLVTLISNAAAATSGTYALNYIAGTGNLQLYAQAALMNRNAELTVTVTNAGMIELEDIYNIVPQVVYDAMQLGISQTLDIAQ